MLYLESLTHDDQHFHWLFLIFGGENLSIKCVVEILQKQLEVKESIFTD
jgi:hypothetical protein